MEDIRPYRDEDDDRDEPSADPVEWDLAGIDTDEDVPFHVPRD